MPDTTLLTYPGLGHDLPEALWGDVADAIVANTRSALSEARLRRRAR